eukprot:54825-Prymnesium_polylepis.1
MCIIDLVGDLGDAMLEKLQALAKSTCVLREATDFKPVLERVAAPHGKRFELILYRGAAPDLLSLLQALSAQGIGCGHMVVLTQALLSNGADGSSSGNASSGASLSDDTLARDAGTWGF